MANYTGHSLDETLTAPFVNQAFFKKGVKIEGTVVRKFTNMNGMSYTISLRNPITLKGKKEKTVAIGDMAGLRMAIAACGLDDLENGDKIVLECIGETDTGKGNPRTDFRIGINRGK